MASLIKANPMAVLSRQASQSQPMAALSKPMAVLSRLAIFEQGCGGAWKGRPLDFSFEGPIRYCAAQAIYQRPDIAVLSKHA